MTREVEYLAAKRRARVLQYVVRANRIGKSPQAHHVAAELRESLSAVRLDMRMLASRGLVKGMQRGCKSGYVATEAGKAFQGDMIGYDEAKRGRATPDVPGLVRGRGDRREDCALYEDCLTKFCDTTGGILHGQCRSECGAFRPREKSDLVAAGMLFGRRVGNLEHGEKGENDE